MPAKNKLVIDTNLWVSWLISKKHTHLSRILSNPNIEIFSSAEQITELFQVIDRSKFSKYIPADVAEEFKLFFIEAVTLIRVRAKVKASRDSKDDFLLALAKTAKAGYLLTGDKDLLVLEKFYGTQIITIAHYVGAI